MSFVKPTTHDVATANGGAADARARRWTGRYGPRAKLILPPLITLVAFVAAWQAVVALMDISAIVLPSPSTVASALAHNGTEILKNALTTLKEAILGLLAGTAVGLLLALVVTEISMARRAIFPLLLASQIVPVIVFAPILLVWFGFGLLSKVIIAAIVSLFPVVINTSLGLRSVPVEMRELAFSVGSPRWKVVRKIKLPHALPYLFAALKPTTTLAMIGAVIGEFLGGNSGLGYLIVLDIRFLALPQMFATVVVLIVMGILIYVVIDRLELLVLRWHRASLARGEG